MKMLGAKVVPATSGSKTLKDAVNEALRDWINNATTTHYIIGSVVGPHPFPDLVARFQSVISEEINGNWKKIGRETQITSSLVLVAVAMQQELLPFCRWTECENNRGRVVVLG